MNVRVSILMLLSSAVLLAGCGNPHSDKFHDGTVSKRLQPPAATIVRNEVNNLFGAPEHLIAAMQFSDGKTGLPVDFGRIDGEVVSSKEVLKPHQFAVKIISEQPLAAADLKGLALIWRSGDYTNAIYEAPKADAKHDIQKGEALTALFHVIDFKPTEDGQGILSVNFQFDAESPVKPGDTFQLVGHRLRSGRQLYMQHCMHCHGFTGDGDGPTAKYLNPRPRDYRLGVFKFKSTLGPKKITRSDLQRIIKAGVPGTYMPSFLLMFNDQELSDVIEYVRWLTLRGEYEHKLGLRLAEQFTKEKWEAMQKSAAAKYAKAVKRWNDDGADPDREPKLASYQPTTYLQRYLDEDHETNVEEVSQSLIRDWTDAESSKFVVRPKAKRPPMTSESISRGRALFLSTKTNCWTCHGVSAKGNGPQTVQYLKGFDPLDKDRENPEPGLYDDWGNKILPRDLTSGIYRGGRRPIDLYRRVYAGIKGTPMPGFSALTDEQIWDLVNYVLSVPHQENGTLPSSSQSSGSELSANKN